MTVSIEIETVAESYAVVRALLEQRDWEQEHNQETAVQAIDNVLKQFEGTSTRVLLENHDDYTLEGEVDE